MNFVRLVPVFLTATLALGCDSCKPRRPPTTTLEQVQRSVPPGIVVGTLSSANGVDVPGVDLFQLTDPNGPPPPADGVAWYKVVAIAGGVGAPILDEPATIVPAVAAATDDPTTLARVGMLVNQRDGTVLTGPTTDLQREANVTAPTRVGDTIEFWVLVANVGLDLHYLTLDLQTGALKPGSPPATP